MYQRQVTREDLVQFAEIRNPDNGEICAELLRIIKQEMGEELSEQRTTGMDNRFHWFSQTQYAALTGDVDDVLKQMQRAVASGYVSTTAFSSPIFDSVREDPRFQDIEQQIMARVDEERAKLGMDPYRPFVATD